jgi:hypothetical protein
LTAEEPREVGWLHYRLAVAVCSAFVAGVMMLIVPLLIGIVGRGPEPLVLYALIFSKWGFATLLVSAILGLIVGGARMANLFAVIWGTHPIWSEMGSWLEEHETTAVALGFTFVALVVGFFWYSFR